MRFSMIDLELWRVLSPDSPYCIVTCVSTIYGNGITNKNGNPCDESETDAGHTSRLRFFTYLVLLVPSTCGHRRNKRERRASLDAGWDRERRGTSSQRWKRTISYTIWYPWQISVCRAGPRDNERSFSFASVCILSLTKIRLHIFLSVSSL